MMKGKSGKSGGAWKGGPSRRHLHADQPSNPQQTRDAAGNPARNTRSGDDRRSHRADDAATGTTGERPARPGGRPGRVGGQPSSSRAGGPTRTGSLPREEGKKPWANRPAAERRAARTHQDEEREKTSRTSTPLAPRRTERSEIRPPREASGRPVLLPRTPAPVGGSGGTPLERRRAYRYGGEVAVDRDIVYGRNAVAEALRAGRRRVRHVEIAEGAEGGRPIGDIATLAQERNVEVRYISRTEIEMRAPGVNHQGVIAEVGPYPAADYADIIETTRDNPAALLLVLDSLQDPQNLGTLLRTAEAAGVTGVVLPEHRAVGVTPAVVNASAGAVEHLQIATVPNLVRAIHAAKAAGAWVIAAEAEPDAIPLAEADLTGPIALVVGSEGQGVSRLLKEACDLVVRIPLIGRVGSLNAATAGSIMLYEIVRQRAEAVALAALADDMDADNDRDGDDADDTNFADLADLAALETAEDGDLG